MAEPLTMTEARRRRLIESLETAPVRQCYTLHCCKLCGESIVMGQMYADRGASRRAHYDCVPGLGKRAEPWQRSEEAGGG